MHLLAGGGSTIGAATAALLSERGIPWIATSRRPALFPAEGEGAARSEAGRGFLPEGNHQLYLDLTAPDAFAIPAGVRSAAIFAAVARLADCADDPEKSYAVNVTGTIALVEKLAAAGVYTLYLSTNQVFDGAKPHMPAGAPQAPMSAYGRQKAETERTLVAMMKGGAPIGILRLSKVVQPGMPLLREWDRALRAGRPIAGFARMRLAPVPVATAAAAVAAMLDRRAAEIAQLSGPRDISYLETARLVAIRAGAPASLVTPGDDAAQPEGALARNTTLDSTWLAETFGITVPDAPDVILAALAQGGVSTAAGHSS